MELDMRLGYCTKHGSTTECLRCTIDDLRQKLEQQDSELCGVCGRPPHPCDDPECVPATAPIAEKLQRAMETITQLRSEFGMTVYVEDIVWKAVCEDRRKTATECASIIAAHVNFDGDFYIRKIKKKFGLEI